MKPRPLTTWEQKERDGTLAILTDIGQQRRRVAENPNSTGDVLAQIARDIDCYPYADTDPQYDYDEVNLITGTILAHPNTSPLTMLLLLDWLRLTSYRSLCCNPVLPFVVLETPDFWEQVDEDTCQEILREEDLPTAVARILLSKNAVSQNAAFHIAVASEINSQTEWKKALRASAFPQYATRHHPPFDLYYLRGKGISHQWMDRLYAVLHLPIDKQSFHEDAAELWKRSPLDLLQHLAHDGNRFVRWAAQTRLADPNFVFTWHEGE